MKTRNKHTTSVTRSAEKRLPSAQAVLSHDVLNPNPSFAVSPQGVLRVIPLALMRRIMDELDRIAHEVGHARNGRNSSCLTPAIEVAEREGEYCIRAQVPGLTPENVRWETTSDSLIIEGNGRINQNDKRKDARLTERQYGHFFRRIPLPEGSNLDRTEATFRNGVLEVTIPKPQPSSKRRVIAIDPDSSAPPVSSRSDAQMKAA